jgi:hypothetical protein
MLAMPSDVNTQKIMISKLLAIGGFAGRFVVAEVHVVRLH